MSRVLLAALVALVPGASLAGQTPTFGASVDVVKLTVTVRDAKGSLVSDLGPEEFRVLEDGRPQDVQVFAPAARPGQDETLALNLGMLIDTSQSMKSQMALAQHAAVRFLDSIPRARDLILIFFDHDIRISRYNSENQQGIFARIAEAGASGNTALYDAIAVYLSRAADSAGRKVLVLLSDGEDSTSALGFQQALGLVRAADVTVYPIAFTSGLRVGSSRYLNARNVLQQLAQVSGGAVYQPVASRELGDIYQTILDELGQQYVLGFVSDDPTPDGKFRKLKVEVARKGLRVRHREGYRAPAPAPPGLDR